MTAILSYMKSYIILFFVLALLISMVPDRPLSRYIRFFARMILVFGIFYPLLGKLGDVDAFLDKIEYESFLQQLEEANLDARKIAYIDNDYYVGKYEDAIAQDVTEMAEEENFVVKEVTVEMTQEYEIERIFLEVSDGADENVIIGKVTVGGETEKAGSGGDSDVGKADGGKVDGGKVDGGKVDGGKVDAAYGRLKETLLQYYQLTEDQLELILT